MFWLNWIKGLLLSLSADTTPEEIGGAFSLGAAIGLIPKSNLSALVIFLITWIFRVNLGIAGLAIILFAIIGHFTDPFTEKLGFWLLTSHPLQGFWTALYNLPVVPYFSLNNTLVTGNLALGALLAVPLFWAARAAAVEYHARFRERVLGSRWMRALQATKYYDLFERWVHRP